MLPSDLPNYEQTPQTCQNSDFQSHFSVLKIDRIFPKKIFRKYWTKRPSFNKNVFENFDFENTLFSKNVPNFCWLCS